MVSFDYIEKINNNIAHNDAQINNVGCLDSYLDKCLKFANDQFEKYKENILLKGNRMLVLEKEVKIDYTDGVQEGLVCGTYIQNSNTIRIFNNCVDKLSKDTNVGFDSMINFLLYHEAFHVIEEMDNINLRDIYSTKTNMLFGIKSRKVGLFSSREIAANYFAYLMMERTVK